MDDLKKVEEFLKAHDIAYAAHFHPAVFTCEEAAEHCGFIPGLHCKNLFLQETNGKRSFLAILPEQKRLDLKKLALSAQVKKLSFGGKEFLAEKLGVAPGSVSLFGILNDPQKSVELYFDRKVYEAEIVSFHPNVNSITFELTHEMLLKFLKITNREVKIVDL